MNKNLTKEFPIKGFTLLGKETSICRADYEDMPCAMKAADWTDEEMTTLADAISTELKQYSFDPTSPYYEDDKDDAFWKEMEECAVHLGMGYYEDDEE